MLEALEAAIRLKTPPGIAFCGGAPAAVADTALYPEERNQIAHAVPKRVAEFAAGRLYARAAMSALGLPPACLPVGPSRAPIWPSGVVGSISHCDGYCGALVAARRDVCRLGLDLEEAAALEPALAEQICRPGELGKVLDTKGVSPDLAPILVFSIKECAYKAASHSMREIPDFHDLEVRLGPSGTFSAKGATPQGIGLFGLSPIHGRFGFEGGIVFSLAWSPSIET